MISVSNRTIEVALSQIGAINTILSLVIGRPLWLSP